MSHAPRPQVAGRQAGGVARVPCGDRAETGVRRSVLEHGEPQGLPVRAAGSRSHGGTAQARRPHRERRRSTSGLRSQRRTRTRATTTGPGEYYRVGQPAPRPLVSTTRWASSRATSRSRRFSAAIFSSGTPARDSSRTRRSSSSGLPRSGSTLIEQILASHSQVEGTLELPTLGEIAVSIGRYRRDGSEYPEVRARPARS